MSKTAQTTQSVHAARRTSAGRASRIRAACRTSLVAAAAVAVATMGTVACSSDDGNDDARSSGSSQTSKKDDTANSDSVSKSGEGEGPAGGDGEAVSRAEEQGEPTFLDPEDLPPHPASEWHAGEVVNGLPDPLPFCVGRVMPGSDTGLHRQYTTDLDTNATQIMAVTGDEDVAWDLVVEIDEAIANCAEWTEEEDPDVTADWEDLGTEPVEGVEDPVHLYAVDTETADGASDIHLFSVGRDGGTVTVVVWGQMGDLDGAPVDDFRQTAITSVEKLY